MNLWVFCNSIFTSHTWFQSLWSLDRPSLIHRVPIFNGHVVVFLLLLVREVLLLTHTDATGEGLGGGLEAGCLSCAATRPLLVVLMAVDPALVDQLHHRLVELGNLLLVKGGRLSLAGWSPRRWGETLVNRTFQLKVFNFLSFASWPKEILPNSSICPAQKERNEKKSKWFCHTWGRTWSRPRL